MDSKIKNINFSISDSNKTNCLKCPGGTYTTDHIKCLECEDGYVNID